MAAERDATLVSAFRGGDRTAGGQLVDRYYAKVVNFCRSKVPSAAKDITQRSFLACFERIETLRDPAAFRTFLFGIVCNQIRMHYRRGRVEGARIDFSDVTSVDLDPSPSQLANERAEQRLLLEGLRRIPLDYQVALELFYWEDMRAADIAEILDIPVGTAKTRIRRARQLLEQALAAIDVPARVLESTTSNLESWARGLHSAFPLDEPTPSKDP